MNDYYQASVTYLLGIQEVIGTSVNAAPSDYMKVCAIYACPVCMGQPFVSGTPRTLTGGHRVVGERKRDTERERSAENDMARSDWIDNLIGGWRSPPTRVGRRSPMGVH